MSRLALDPARALDPGALAAGVGMVLDPWRSEVLGSDHPWILLNCCRQSGKSTTCAVKAVRSETESDGSDALSAGRSGLLIFRPQVRILPGAPHRRYGPNLRG